MVHIPIHILPAIVMPLLSLLDQCQGTHIFNRQFFLSKVDKFLFWVIIYCRITFYGKKVESCLYDDLRACPSLTTNLIHARIFFLIWSDFKLAMTNHDNYAALVGTKKRPNRFLFDIIKPCGSVMFERMTNP